MQTESSVNTCSYAYMCGFILISTMHSLFWHEVGIKQWKADYHRSTRVYKVICRVEVFSKTFLTCRSKIEVNVPFTVQCKDVKRMFFWVWGFDFLWFMMGFFSLKDEKYNKRFKDHESYICLYLFF